MAKDTKAGRDTRNSKDTGRKGLEADRPIGERTYEDDEDEELDQENESEEGDGLRRPQRSDRSRGR